MKSLVLPHAFRIGIVWLCATAVLAQPAPPAALAPGPANAVGEVSLSWTAVAGATSYNVKRSGLPGGPHTFLANVATTNYSDNTAIFGATYFYAVTTIDGTGESAAFREVAASPVIIRDNSDAAGVSSSGSWPLTTLTGSFGSNSAYAATTSSGSPTASFTLTPSLPMFGNYDVYLRWPAHANRTTNAPVDINFADGHQSTITVNQTTNGGEWRLLGTFSCEPGTSCNVTIRNNTGSGGAYVGADAVQFVPRRSPWGARATGLEDYSVTGFSDEISGTTLDTSLWALALNRSNVSVSGGKISLDLTYIGPGTADTATQAELKSPYNWSKGAVQPVHDHKYGFYETRFRVVQAGGGADCAFWQNSKGSLLPWEDFEFDSPETFPDASLTETDLIYGMWNHVGGSPPWRMNAIHKNHDWGIVYHTYGMEWRTDNTLVHYLDGVQIGSAPATAVNGMACMAPVAIYLSTYAGNYWQPTAALDGQSMKVDYLRCYQKPGWLGAASGNWTEARNWGPDGVPGPAEAAVFNLPTSQPVLALNISPQVHSLCFDGSSVSAMTLNGPGQLTLGAGGNGVIQGGISMGSSVTSNQTVNAAIRGLRDLSFINNSASGAALILNGQVDGSPGGALRAIRFAANQPIVVSQPFAGGISDVIKWGTSEFNMPSNSMHVGCTLIAQGTMVFNHLANGGQPSGLGASSANPTNVIFYPREKYADEPRRPRLRYTGPAATTDRGVALGHICDGILEASGSGPITWSGPVVFNPGNTSYGILTLGGTNTDDNTYAGVISDVGSGITLRLRKEGGGRWVLTGSNSVAYPVSVRDGTLLVNSPGSITGNVTVEGGVFGGTGIVTGDITVNGGVVAPGASPGVLRVGDDFILNANGTLLVKLFGTTPGTGYDQVELIGAGSAITLAGALEVFTTNNLPLGAEFVIVTNAGAAAVNGTFIGQPNGSAIAAGNTNWFRISYTGGTGNDVVLTRIATPANPTLAASFTNGLTRLTFGGLTNVNYRILASTNLVNWTPILTTNPPVLPFSWTDADATVFPTRYYRIQLGP